MTRAEWSLEHTECMVCGHVDRWPRWLETHEIACGPARQAALEEPATWLRACGEPCHQGKHGLHDYATWPIARQLALKKKCDPKYYDRKRVNGLRRREPDAITEDEVNEFLEKLKPHEP